MLKNVVARSLIGSGLNVLQKAELMDAVEAVDEKIYRLFKTLGDAKLTKAYDKLLTEVAKTQLAIKFATKY